MTGQRPCSTPASDAPWPASDRQAIADVVAASPWPVLALSPRGEVLAASDDPDLACSELAQRAPLYLAALRQPLPWHAPLEAWCEHARPDGSLRCEHLHGRPARWGATITAVPAAEAAAPAPAVDAQTARLAALGFMVAGVCHEVTNPLTSLHSIVQILRTDQGRTPGLLDKGLDNVAGSVQRILDISRRLVTFSRVGDEPRGRFAVDDIVDEALAVLRQQGLMDGIAVQRQRDDRALAIVRMGQVREVFLNLLANALQAMAGRGRLRVQTACADDTVRVDVADSGPGVPAAWRDRIFEPFFTTKAHAAGTGLGLPISREIAIEHGGSVELLAPGAEGGASFRVTLPRAA